jgi:hypothetical protein
LLDAILSGKEGKWIMNTSAQTLPVEYVQSGEINLKKNKRLAVLLNVVAFFVFILSFIPLSIFGGVIRSGTANFSGSITVGTMLILIGLTVIVLIIHELIHGLLFWVFTRSKPVFALHLLYAYAGAPNWYIPSRQYAFIALGPLVIIGVVGLFLMLLVPVSWILMIAFLVALNTGGAIGDIYVFARLLKGYKTSIVNDTGNIFTFYEQKGSIRQP